MWVTPPSPRFYLAIEYSSTFVVKRFFPVMETECARSMKESFLVYFGHQSCYVRDQWNLTHCFSISGESCCQTVEMCKEQLCGSKELSGCFVKQQVLDDNSCWAPKSCFSLALLLNVNVGHGRNAIFYHTAPSQSPVPCSSSI